MPPSRERGRGDRPKEGGVDDGDRTRDNRIHSPVLYQLSYVHHRDGRSRVGRLGAPHAARFVLIMNAGRK